MSEDVDPSMALMSLPAAAGIAAIWLIAVVVLARDLKALINNLWPGERS